MKKMKKQVSTTKVYINAQGKRCWTGTRHLKATQFLGSYRHSWLLVICWAFWSIYIYIETIYIYSLKFSLLENRTCVHFGTNVFPGLFDLIRYYPPKFGVKLLQLFPDFLEQRHHPAKLGGERKRMNAMEVFKSTEWLDLWEDAQMVEVLQYLMGNKHLSWPPGWRELFPTEL